MLFYDITRKTRNANPRNLWGKYEHAQPYIQVGENDEVVSMAPNSIKFEENKEDVIKSLYKAIVVKHD